MSKNPGSDIGSNIRKIREHLGWTQSDLAVGMGFASSQIISSIETGQRELKASEVIRIAKILKVPVESLLRGDTAPVPVVQWREKSESAGKEVEANFIERARRYARLEEWCKSSTAKQLGQLQLGPRCTFSQVQEEADKIRRYMELGGRPALSLAKALEEDYGVKIFHEDLGENGAGMSARGDFGLAVLLNSCDAPWRRNYSLGHELFHLLAPEELDREPSDRIEQLANIFSSQLLLPPDAIETFVKSKVVDAKLSYRDLIEGAREFNVSSEAMLWRLVNLGKVDRDSVVRAMKDEKFRILDRASFPTWDRPSPLPERYCRLAMIAYQRGKLGLARLAEFLETNIVDLAEDVSSVEVGMDALDTAQVPVT